MKRAALALGPYVLLLAPFVSAQSPGTRSGASVWDVLVAPSMDSEKTAVAENVDIVRDRVHITLVSGTIQFAKPANGVVFAGRLRMRALAWGATNRNGKKAPRLGKAPFVVCNVGCSSYLPALGVIGGSGKIGRRFGSPRAPRISTSSKRSEGATTAAGRPLCALPNAPSAVPAMPVTWLCM
jgi:hypothetical protein